MIDDPFDSPSELPWPRKGETLFDHADDWHHNACLGWQANNWDAYASSYKSAGDILVQHVIDTRADQDLLVFPIVFNYRQYVELRCKELIRVGRMLLDQDATFPATHNLQALWSVCRGVVSEVEPSDTKSDLEAIDESIAQFCAVDPTSQSFRYPIDREGNCSLPEALRIINLRHLRDGIDRLASFFDGGSMAFSAYLDNKAEMASYYMDSL